MSRIQVRRVEPSGNLVADLVAASMDANFRTMDTLYESEKRRRMALESLIEITLRAADKAWAGTAREYEAVLDILRDGTHGREDFLVSMHRESEES